MTWKHPSTSETKKFKVQRSAAKVMAIVFWDAKGVILLDILPQGQCISSVLYCNTRDCLRDVILCKRPGLLRRGFVLQHDNATLIQQTLHSNGCSATVGKFFLILPKIHTSYPLTFISLDP
ncbi:histone-lysine N-methyltransferase SETMAR [Elysia marginata]|uniref:Histone-lysine N-methyltransferase SETMAR n=1 Tax=Elysia marginata TaxID=1093978 RepID=A0AAV4G2R8_9GAST|nr:histone-lysine N-methyltransferase SETMAR [Elysia marginata]